MHYRVGFLVRGLCDGGAERVVANLASQHAANGCHTVVITRNHSDGDYRLDARVVRYELDRYVGDDINHKTWIRRMLYIRKICRDEKLDVLVAFMDDSIPYAILATKFLKTKSIISVRNAPEILYVSKKYQRMVKFLYPLADGAVFQTNDARDWFPKRLQDKSAVLMNPISDVFYSVTYQPDELRVVNCGRLDGQKNQKILIEAFSLVLKTIKNATLHIYGAGLLQGELEKLIDDLDLRKNVFLEGRTNDVAKMLSTASVFVLSSDFEGSPNALMEAMAVGVPSISTDCPCGGPRMLIGDNENGILVPIGDKKGLAEAIVRILTDSELRKTYSDRCKLSSLLFSEENVIKDWNKYISFIIRN